MADPFATALAALHRAAGSVAAIYTPAGGVSQAVRVIWTQGSALGATLSDRRVSDTNSFDVMRSDVARPARGDTIAVVDPLNGAALAFRLNAAPILDIEGLGWTCPAEPA